MSDTAWWDEEEIIPSRCAGCGEFVKGSNSARGNREWHLMCWKLLQGKTLEEWKELDNTQ